MEQGFLWLQGRKVGLQSQGHHRYIINPKTPTGSIAGRLEGPKYISVLQGSAAQRYPS